MKKQVSFLKLFLKYAALISLFLTAFPFIAFLSSLKQLHSSALLWLTVASVLSGFFGFSLRNFLEETKKLKAYQISLFILLGAVLPIACAYILSGKFSADIVAKILACAVFIGVYIVGLIVFNDEYYKILTPNWVITAGLINMLTIVISKLFKLSLNISSFVIIFIISISICAFAANQKSIDYMMERRGHSMAHLPPKIRYYNLLLVLSVLSLAVLFFIFKEEFTVFAYKTLDLLKNGFLGILRFLVAFFNKLKGADTGHGNGQTETNEDGDFIDTSESGNPIISAIVFGIIVATIIIFSVKPLYRKAEALFKALASIIRNWIQKSRRTKFIRSEKNEYYTDTEEALGGASKRPVFLGLNKEYRIWKNELKKFSKMAESKEKMILGYRLAVKGLSLHGYEISVSDTQLDILKKAKSRLSGKAFEVATYCYNELVFGLLDTDLKLFEMDETLKAIKAFPTPKKT